MLFPKSTRQRLQKEHVLFNQKYVSIVSQMREIMQERGEIRDSETPIYYRRNPFDCLGMTKHKSLRIEALLTKLDSSNPQKNILVRIIDECIDASNYLLFIASLCTILMDEEE